MLRENVCRAPMLGVIVFGTKDGSRKSFRAVLAIGMMLSEMCDSAPKSIFYWTNCIEMNLECKIRSVVNQPRNHAVDLIAGSLCG
jgi:hypothetical protein